MDHHHPSGGSAMQYLNYAMGVLLPVVPVVAPLYLDVAVAVAKILNNLLLDLRQHRIPPEHIDEQLRGRCHGRPQITHRDPALTSARNGAP
jgi:hypothetical protein